MRQPAEKTAFQVFRQEVIGTQKLSGGDAKTAGRLYKQGKMEAAREWLLKGARDDVPPNFQPPAKCLVVAVSHPFEEWDISKTNHDVQAYIYAQPLQAEGHLNGLSEKWEDTSADQHKLWFEKTGVPDRGLPVQAINKIAKAAVNRAFGVVRKVENRNEKRRSRDNRIAEHNRENGLTEVVREAPEVATNADGFLLHPPGIDPSILSYASVSPVPYNSSKHSFVRLPEEYQAYNVEPDAPIPQFVVEDRFAIPPGQPGYVPEWQRLKCSTNKHRRMRQWSNQDYKPKAGRRAKPLEFQAHLTRERAKGALLVVMRIKEDWVVFDVRGLLRNVEWRKVLSEEAREKLTLKGLLDLFTGDPVIDTKRGIVTFLYKAEITKILSKRTVKTKNARDLLLRLTEPGEDGLRREVGLVAVDLGQTHPIAAAIYRIGRTSAGALESTVLHRQGLREDQKEKLKEYRKRHTALDSRLRKEAFETLSVEQQKEIVTVSGSGAQITKDKVCNYLGVDPSTLPWEKMGSYTHFISDDFLRRGGDPNIVHFDRQPKKGKVSKKSQRIKRSDSQWVGRMRPRLSQETAKARMEADWAAQNENEEYKRLARSKQELARWCVNTLLQNTRCITQCDEIVVVIEDLNVKSLHGKGAREPGWDNFFTPKTENRWFIQILHKTFSELPKHRGEHVIEGCPLRTSITCPACSYCDKNSRNGEKFVCVACGATFHADFEVATYNLVRLATTGMPMPKSLERQGGGEKAGGARKARKKAKQVEKIVVQANANVTMNGASLHSP